MNIKDVRSREDLISILDKKERCKYVFFWGHKKSSNGETTKSCFSQWWMSDFVVDEVRYPSCEHYMMAEKAKLFDDQETLERILNAKSPAEAKKFGRLVKGFSEDVWLDHRFEIVVKGSVAKFSQNEELKKFLIATGSKILVEASPVDRIWGTGMDQNDEHAENPRLWKGLNLLGFALMEARERIAAIS
jgi:ribA/ribD-fused uncharacterized protein